MIIVEIIKAATYNGMAATFTAGFLIFCVGVVPNLLLQNMVLAYILYSITIFCTIVSTYYLFKEHGTRN